jgi:TonB family protein
MNETLLQYLLESSIGLVLLYLFFVLVLRRETSFQFNRLYLLASLLLAFVVPLTRLPGINLWPASQEQEVVELPTFDQATLETVTMAPVIDAPQELYTYWQLLYLLYGLGVLFFFFRFVAQLWHLGRFARQTGTAFYLPGQVPVILTHGQFPTFSFWRYIFFDNSQALTAQETERILQHEQVHIQQRHTLDILLVSLAGIVFWFNPLLLLYKKAMEQTHEFIADAHVAKDAGTSAYSSLLVKQVLRTADFPLDSYFFLNQSLTLTRIKMMKKLHQSPRLSRLLLVVPTVALLFVAIAAMRPAPVEDFPTPGETSLSAGKVKDAPAMFPGGPDALSAFVKSNFMLPEVAFQKRKSPNDFVKMTAVVEVTIQKNGAPVFRTTTNLQVIPNTPEVGVAVQKQLEKLVQQMPAWAPAQKDGRAVESIEKFSVSRTSGNFVKLEGVAEGQQQKTKVSTESDKSIPKESPKTGRTNIIPELVMVYYPAAQKAVSGDLEKKASPGMKMPPRTTTAGEKIYMIAEKMPEFPGGSAAMRSFLASKFRIPLAAQHSEIEGTMVGAFVVSASGEVSRIDIVQSLSPSLDQELKRVLGLLPAFAPGEIEGKRVPVLYLVPFRIVAKRATATNATKGEVTVEGKPSGASAKEGEKGKTTASDIKSVTVEGEKVFIAVEKMPEFPGGMAAMMQYLKENTAYPEDAKAAKIEGTAVASFIVNSTGKVTDVQLLKKLHPSVDQEFIKALEKMPNWTPGTQNGKAVNVKYTVPLRIQGGVVLLKSSNSSNSNSLQEKVVVGSSTNAPKPNGQVDERTKAIFKFLDDNFKMPEDAPSSKMPMRLYITYVVSKDGKVSNPRVVARIAESRPVKDVPASVEKEILRVFSLMPAFQLANQNGESMGSQEDMIYTIGNK